MDVDDSGRSDRAGVAETARSARGWHGVQLGVLAFISAADGQGDGEDATGATVEITAHDGATACGQLLDAPSGTIRLATASGAVELATSGLAAISPTDSC
jgi:hypothetical protein